MPAVLTHDFFGRDAIPLATEVLGTLKDDAMDVFLLGNQGPDPLFYLVIDPFIGVESRVGGLMHHSAPTQLLAALSNSVAAHTGNEKRLARAWYAGFCCHYLLDSAMHPLVYFWENNLIATGVTGLGEEEHSNVHAEIERDFDEMVLFTKLGRTIETYKTYKEVLNSSDEALSAVDSVISDAVFKTYNILVDAGTFTHATKSFRIMQRIFYSPSGALHKGLGTIERVLTKHPHSFYCAMAHRTRAQTTSDFDNREHKTWENPFTGDVSSDSFWDLYNKALARVPSALAVLLDENCSVEDAYSVTCGLNFSGEPV